MGILDGDGTYSPMDKYLVPAATASDSMSLGQKVAEGAVATVADIGTTYWNSITPEKYNSSTSDLLQRIDPDAAQVYNENEDTIKTLSFIGGMVAPIGLSIKGMNMLRGGSAGFSWFSNAGQAARMAEAESAFANAGVDSNYIAAKWAMYRGVAYNAIADNAAAELAIVSSMNAHPFMDDYYKDFGSNFLKSVAFGSALQTGIGSILAKTDLGVLTGKIQNDANKLIKQAIIQPLEDAQIDARSHLGQFAAIQMQGIDNLKAILAKSVEEPDFLNKYTIARVEDQILRGEASVVQRLKDASTGDLFNYLKDASKDQAEYFLNFISKVENAGLDKVGFATVKGESFSATKGLTTEPTLTKLVKRIIDGEEVPTLVKTDAYWSPLYNDGKGAYFATRDGSNYLTIADLGKSVKQLQGEVDNTWGRLPDHDWSTLMVAEHTAILDSQYAKAILATEEMSGKDLNRLILSPDDLPKMKAVLLRASKLENEDPTFKLNLRVTREAPSWGAVQQNALSVKGGVPSNYVEQITALSKHWDNFSVYHAQNGIMNNSISRELGATLDRWINGSYGFLRNGARLFKDIENTLPGIVKPDALKIMQAAKMQLEELYNTSQSRALRAELMKLADVDGNVWLYRGMWAEPKGHLPLESYTILPDKAAEFGSGYTNAVKMYKIAVDDIVGTVHDFGRGFKPEILAFPPTRDYEQISKSNLRALPDVLNIQAPKVVTVSKNETAIMSNLNDVKDNVYRNTLQSALELSKRGYGIETIALKLGIPADSVPALLSTKTVDGAGLFKYTNKTDVEMSLDLSKRALSLSTNMNKVPQPELFAELNKRNLNASSMGILEYFLLSSPSQVLQKFGQEILSPNVRILTDELGKELTNVNSTQMKNSFFANANQVLSAFGPISSIATDLGKRTITMKQHLVKFFEEPLANAFNAIIKEGEASLIEFNTAMNVNSSIKGARFYKEGVIWIPREGTKASVIQDLIAMDRQDFIKALVEDRELAMPAQYLNKDYQIQSKSVQAAFDLMQPYGREMYSIKNANLQSMGKGELSDIGLWVPSNNLRNKSVAYVFDRRTDTISMLYADTDPLLATAIQEYKDKLANTVGINWRKFIDVVQKNQQEEFNMMAGRHDPMFMGIADVSKQHGGSSTSTVVSTDTSVMKNILQGYQDHTYNAVEDMMELHLNNTMNTLKMLSDESQGVYSKETKGILEQLKSKPIDVGQTVRNIILGRSNLSEHKAWGELQQRTQVYTDLIFKSISDLFQPIIAPIVGKSSAVNIRTATNWDNVVKEMDDKGIIHGFEGIDKELGLNQYLREGKGGNQTLTPRVIALGNALAATTLFRFMEVAQPLVNALSLPVLTSAAINKKLAGSFMGSELDPMAKFTLSRTMMNGTRLWNHPVEGPYWSKLAEQQGMFDVTLRNVTEMMSHQRSLDPGVLTSVETFLDNFTKEGGFLRYTAKLSDVSEQMVRKQSFFTGVSMAKEAYPGLSDTGIMTFARNFMDEAVGNYSAAQRPAFFQGTFGTAMGLFQTYMLTLAQNIYRQVEHRDWKSLGKMMLTQSSIFGAAALPGFHNVSEAIATNFSDNHIDLETGTFRAIPDMAANILLYGAPSSFGPGLVTRGDINPRVPNPLDMTSLAVVNLTGQAYKAMEHVVKAAYHADGNTGQAMLEALSMQSLSRPVARISELATGRSLTGRGDVVADNLRPDNINNLMTLSTLSRVMSTRPLEEIKAREALHLNTLYGQSDADKQGQVTARLKSIMRSGDPNPDQIDKLADIYMRTGTTTGWSAAVNNAVRQEGQSANATTIAKLKPTSPLNRMISDLQ